MIENELRVPMKRQRGTYFSRDDLDLSGQKILFNKHETNFWNMSSPTT